MGTTDLGKVHRHDEWYPINSTHVVVFLVDCFYNIHHTLQS